MNAHNARQISIDRSRPGVWIVTINNPPINMLDQETIDELQDLVSLFEKEEALKAVVFESADPDYFIAHYDLLHPTQSSTKPGPTGYAPWLDFVLRLSKAPVVSVAKVRGRTRGVGNEFILACDLRFASREKSVFGQPEVGVGVIPGGGALEWLPRLVGRSRALEIVLSADDFDADTAERYGMINRAVDDAKLDTYVEALTSRIASFEKQTLQTAKQLLSEWVFRKAATWTPATAFSLIADLARGADPADQVAHPWLRTADRLRVKLWQRHQILGTIARGVVPPGYISNIAPVLLLLS